MKKPLITVAMPVYNAEKYLAEAIDSILSQTFNDFEFIIIDDGSTDNSLEIIKKYKILDDRIIVVSRPNKKLVATLNEIIDLAKGEWLARMDSDDISMPYRFERQLKQLIETEADICGSWIKTFGDSNRIVKHAQSNEAIKMELLFGTPFAHPTVIIKLDKLKKLKYDNTWEQCEDYDLWERAAQSNWIMTNVPEILLEYRVHKTQISNQSSIKQQELSCAIRRRYWQFLFTQHRLDKSGVEDVLRMREPVISNINMLNANQVFEGLLNITQGEAREVVFTNITNLYYRVAGVIPNIVCMWAKLNANFGNGNGFSVKAKLYVLSALKIRAESTVFRKLKALYFRLVAH